MSASKPQSVRQVRDALEQMRDCGDRPGMYEEAADALVALDSLEEQLETLRVRNQFLSTEQIRADSLQEMLGRMNEQHEIALEASRQYRNEKAELQEQYQVALGALRTVRAECDLPEHVAEIVGEVLYPAMRQDDAS